MVVRGKILTESGTIRCTTKGLFSLSPSKAKKEGLCLEPKYGVPYFGHILLSIIYIVSVYMVYGFVQEYTNKEGLRGGVNKKEEVGRGKKGGRRGVGAVLPLGVRTPPMGLRFMLWGFCESP